ncbi:hypothetical protein [Flavobacterium gilvum]|uniref:SGNH/GDSL hydrolase family protein n=1 Tax=Flavobacterium gilvum TaxID=1492737 RepID=A0AAC9I283_9FLAO|nr:hypothetical protein [Flavobacterium gilvum]AOW08121.1 hypothetical protein EM308_00590 [Flavobacterium gilvum]KFC57602.1 hypothetical protein FEM08_36210 [Flavobacterium gilvum]
MKKFLLFTLKILISIIVLAVVLDFLYTTVYLQSTNRGKIEDVFNSKSRKYDVIILGSSRANNHFVAQMFEEKGLKTFNYGMSGGHLFEASLLLKLMIERNYQIKNVILEADLNLSNDHQAEGISAKFLPYLHKSEVIRKHFEQESDFNELYYIPFYRYIKYDTKIGFREIFKIVKCERTSALDNLGYYPLVRHKKGNMKNDIVNLKPLPHNKYYEEIKSICKANNINFIAVMTPMCENVVGMNYFDKVKKTYPEIHNYENVVVENKYFSSCGHMNDTGARLFTAIILRDFFNK